MKEATLDQVQGDLPRYLDMAMKEQIVITRAGVPAGILIGFDEEDDLWEELLLRDPRFIAQVAEARRGLRAGKGVSIEQLRQQYGLEAADETSEAAPHGDEDGDAHSGRAATS